MVMATQEGLKNLARVFETVKAAADTFVQWANDQIETRGVEVEVESALPQKRGRKKKNRAGEMAEDDPLRDANRAFEVNVHNIILDTALEAIHRRFMTHGTLFADLAWLDPRSFDKIRTTTFPNTAFEVLSKCLMNLTAVRQWTIYNQS
jgi:hypothetical protein